MGAAGKMGKGSKRKLREILKREKTGENQHRHYPTTGITLSEGREPMYRAISLLPGPQVECGRRRRGTADAWGGLPQPAHPKAGTGALCRLNSRAPVGRCSHCRFLTQMFSLVNGSFCKGRAFRKMRLAKH